MTNNVYMSICVSVCISVCVFVGVCIYRPPDERGRPEGPCYPLYLKLHFARKVFLDIRFCVILQGIRYSFGTGTPRTTRGPGVYMYIVVGFQIKKINFFVKFHAVLLTIFSQLIYCSLIYCSIIEHSI